MKILGPRIIVVKSFETMPGATPERVVASGVVGPRPISANPHHVIFENPKKAVTRGQPKIKVPWVCIWHTNVSAPSARKAQAD